MLAGVKIIFRNLALDEMSKDMELTIQRSC